METSGNSYANLVESEDVILTPSFDAMELSEELLRGIYSYGFEKPSQIQQKGIVPMVKGKDLLAQAPSGTGKTGTFVIGSLSHVNTKLKKPQVLILVPTHELADQINTFATHIGKYMKLKTLLAVGGGFVKDDVKALEDGVHFIVGTPGRVYDLIHRGALSLEAIQWLIMDEADVMLEDLFYKQVMLILGKGFPVSTKVALFSATMLPQVVEVADKILSTPVKILIPPSAVRLEGIQQFYVGLEREDFKFECICDLYKNLNITRAVIFCNRKQKAEMLSEKMGAAGYPVSCIHGDLDKSERRKRLDQFKNGDTRVMIATDIIARGIDVQQLSLVINYELPSNRENYIHRIGRAGRYGRKGTTINLLVPEESSMMDNICNYYSIKMNEVPANLNDLIV
jgi:translation initiation factor 4A